MTSANVISDSLKRIAAQIGAKFYLNESFISFDEVFSPTGLLPSLVTRADQLASMCMGYGLGADFEEAEEALSGKKVVFDKATPNAIRLLFITDVLEELIQGGPTSDHTPLDELLYD